MCRGGSNDVDDPYDTPPEWTSIACRSRTTVRQHSSKWVHEKFPSRRHFAWQEGYGAFSIGISQVDETTRYINSQAEHHRRMTFQEEFRAFLERHGIEYDPRHVWG